MSVAPVLAIADIGHDDEFRNLAFYRAYRLLHDAVLGIGPGRDFVFRLGDSKQNYPTDSQLQRFGAFLDDVVDRQLRVTWHRADLAANAFAGACKQRKNKIVGREFGFTNEPAHRVARAQAPHSLNWKGHGLGSYAS